MKGGIFGVISFDSQNIKTAQLIPTELGPQFAFLYPYFRHSGIHQRRVVMMVKCLEALTGGKVWDYSLIHLTMTTTITILTLWQWSMMEIWPLTIRSKYYWGRNEKYLVKIPKHGVKWFVSLLQINTYLCKTSLAYVGRVGTPNTSSISFTYYFSIFSVMGLHNLWPVVWEISETSLTPPVPVSSIIWTLWPFGSTMVWPITSRTSKCVYEWRTSIYPKKVSFFL